jgi:hypothetical protein
VSGGFAFVGCNPLLQPKKAKTMKKLLLLTAAAGLVFALAEPTFAAKRVQHGFDAYASSDRSGAFYYGPLSGPARATYGLAPGYAAPFDQPETPAQHIYEAAPGGNSPPNFPYPDRPYGAPDGW